MPFASRIFHVDFKPVAKAPVWDPSVECFEVRDEGKLIGRFYLDMHPRPNKYNHAAEFNIRTGAAGRQALLLVVPQRARTHARALDSSPIRILESLRPHAPGLSAPAAVGSAVRS